MCRTGEGRLGPNRLETGTFCWSNRPFEIVVSVRQLATRIYSATRLLLEEQTDEPVLVAGR